MPQEPFDPYRKWLGIPPRDQPPNHYRLLGIEVFESDPDVISNAADGRMGQIRTFQTGRHSEWSQRLLNEVAAARVCLLNEANKAAYDKSLRQEFGAQIAPPVTIHRGGTPPLAPPEIASLPPGIPSVVPSASGSGASNRQRPLILIAVVAAAMVLVGLAALLLRPGGGPDDDPSPGLEPDAEVAIQDSTAEDDTAPQPAEISPDDEDPPEDEAESEGGESGQAMDVVADGQDMKEGVAGDLDPGTSSEPPPASPNPKPKTPPDTPATKPKGPGLAELRKPPSRLVPAESAREAARRRIREIFQDDFDSSGTPAEKVALAAKLRQQGIETDDDPAARFVFLKMAVDLAATGADPREAFRAIDAIKEHYDADVLEMKADVLTSVVKVLRSGETGAHLAQAAALLAEEAVVRDDYKTADRLLTVGGLAARKGDNKIIADELTARKRDVSRTARAYAPVEKALAVLVDNPLDTKANGEVGQWRCFEKNDWSEGLACLAKGDNTALADLAKRDLAALGDLSNPEQQRQLGDAWWDLSGKARGAAKAAYICRAAYWYQKALVGITGLDRAALSKRLETAARDNHVVKSRTWGTVEKGNVALATKGATVEGVEANGRRLLNGRATRPANARGKCPCEWVITFAKPYRLEEIRFRLWDLEPRSYRYVIGTSPDGGEFVTLADRSQGNWSSWQQFKFSSRLVKSVKIIGLYGSVDEEFLVNKFEAYCVPPATPPNAATQ